MRLLITTEKSSSQNGSAKIALLGNLSKKGTDPMGLTRYAINAESDLKETSIQNFHCLL